MQGDWNILLIGSVFLAGIFSFFSPCVFPLLPVYMGELLGNFGQESTANTPKKSYLEPFIKTLAFVSGISMVFFMLGFGAGALGHILYHPYVAYVMGFFAILLGLHQMEVINFSMLQRQKSVNFNKKRVGGILGAFLLGLTFSFGWTPCIGPVLGSLLAVVISGGSSAWYGGFLMVIYSAGLSIPFLLLAVTSSWIMERAGFIKRHLILLKKIGGLLIVFMGILLWLGQFNVLSGIFL